MFLNFYDHIISVIYECQNTNIDETINRNKGAQGVDRQGVICKNIGSSFSCVQEEQKEQGMSDANTDLARENRRACFYAYYLNALEAYLKDPVEDRWHAVLSRAKEADSVKGGFLSGPTSFEERASELMIGLVRDDKDCWARFLFSLEDSDYFQKFKAISPFADQMLVAVDYGFGFVNIRGDFQSFIDSLIDGDWGMKTYGGEKYVVVLNEPTKDSADVICVGCGIKGASGPRSVKE